MIGAPQLGQRVRVVRAIDIEIHDVRPHIGRLGKVVPLSGRTPPVGVRLTTGVVEAFWEEELAPA